MAGKPEENVKEVVKKIIDVKPPKNCTNYRGIGIKGVECIFVNLKNQEMDKKKVFKTIGIVLLVWLALYLAIAIPLWCIKGKFLISLLKKKKKLNKFISQVGAVAVFVLNFADLIKP